MGGLDDIEAAVSEVREFNRVYTRLIGALDYPEKLRTPYSLTEARVLYELARRDRTHVQSIRQDLGLAASHLSRMLSRFEEQGLITRERYADDARHHQVRLTEAGRAAAAELDERSKEAISDLLRGRGGVRIRNLTEALRTVRATLTGPPARSEIRLREPAPGELGWIVQAHGALYAREFGWDADFEALVARIVADFAEDHDPLLERVWIAELDGRPVGSVMCVRDAAPDTARLRLLLLDPAARGYGLGDRLVHTCIQFAREAGYRELVLWTNDVLAAARKIYTRAGFELVAEKPHHSYGQDLVGQDWRLTL
ncbi:helix-turn-helix domain-containing GNAT family N-acetyltransferase [Streptomyces sp. SKN60]|uniref:bifunctional helix-turn-helix transcriptional regulator/GNAT family N-acetyltransferase n=1 Tax=Streptomyces sp. SKN60 TaxID=2855506 RepID=UPI00224837EA|nr:helix-turn-helix domain-containing GNAT family N-acetyltransferase [Streptomyces sp. SKN60]MCX2180925.1 helix-turn-helix domain-containing GNAT family N-acetyltransferase [Streptomyces sp. SKN60]